MIKTSSCIFLVFAIFNLYSQSQVDEVVRALDSYRKRLPVEKVYVHTSRDILTLGDTLYFCGYVLDGQSHQAFTVSKLLYADIITPASTIHQTLKLRVDSLGCAYGDFAFTDSLIAGTYRLRAYTNYQRNFHSDYLFSKEIKVLPRLSRQQTYEPKGIIQTQEFKMNLYPEGGELISGQVNLVAFEVKDNRGVPLFVEGKILNSKGEKVSAFRTEHEGMGYFQLQPKRGESYLVTFEYNGLLFEQPVSNIVDQGYVLHVRNTPSEVTIMVRPQSSSMDSTFIVIQSRDRVVFNASPSKGAAHMFFSINRNQLPSGIIQITFFDKNRRAVAERLVYNENPTESTQLRLNINPVDKELKTRSKASLSYDLTLGNSQKPEFARLSTSIVPANLYVKPEQSIRSCLLLTSDLRGKINNPSQYFDLNNANRLKHIDLLLLTHGWRRFAWEKVLGGEEEEFKYLPDRGINVEGRVTSYLSKNKPVSTDMYFALLENPMSRFEGKSAEDGYFKFDGMFIQDTVTAFIKTLSSNTRKRDKDQVNRNTSVQIYQQIPPNVDRDLLLAQVSTDIENKAIERGKKLFDISASFDQDIIVLDEVKVEGRRNDSQNVYERSGMRYSSPDKRIILDSLNSNPVNIYELLMTVPGVRVIGDFINPMVVLRGATGTNLNDVSALNEPGADIPGPLFVLDGIEMDQEFISSFPVDDILFIDILQGVGGSAYGSRGGNGVIAIYTRRPGEYKASNVEAIGLVFFPLVGYYAPRDFYEPDYDAPSEDEKRRPDFRSTLYWNPTVKVKNGKAQDTFFTSDEKGSFVIYTEGIDRDGNIYTGHKSFEVH